MIRGSDISSPIHVDIDLERHDADRAFEHSVRNAFGMFLVCSLLPGAGHQPLAVPNGRLDVVVDTRPRLDLGSSFTIGIARILVASFPLCSHARPPSQSGRWTWQSRP